MLLILMPLLFLAGIIAIALEEKIGVNKAAVAVGMSVLLWVLFIIGGEGFFAALPHSSLQFLGDINPDLFSMPVKE